MYVTCFTACMFFSGCLSPGLSNYVSRRSFVHPSFQVSKRQAGRAGGTYFTQPEQAGAASPPKGSPALNQFRLDELFLCTSQFFPFPPSHLSPTPHTTNPPRPSATATNPSHISTRDTHLCPSQRRLICTSLPPLLHILQFRPRPRPQPIHKSRS